jgi:serine/threonine protein kinase
MGQYNPGDQIDGEYNVLKVFGGVGRSGMGVVYLVEHRDAPFPIVLKTYQGGADPETRRQFVAEAKAWIDVGPHPNVVQAYWVRDIAGVLFVAAEYIAPDDEDRNSVKTFLEGARVRTEVVLGWAVQFCHGMSFASTKGVVAHRDIKPDNLMIGPDGILKVTDFGLAKSVLSNDLPASMHRWWPLGRKSSPEPASASRTGSVRGTLPYMPPEQFVDSKRVDSRADIYSFGIVLYQLESGNQYPYRLLPQAPDMVSEFYRAHSSESPSPIRSILWPVIERCLQKAPGQRYSSYDELLAHLGTIASIHGITIPSSRPRDARDEALYAKAQSAVALGDSDGALRSINEYVKAWPENACGWTEKGRIHLERGEPEPAIEATRASLKINPYNSHAWNNLGIALARAGRPTSEVRQAFAAALEWDAGNATAMLNLVGPIMAEGKVVEAARLTSEALRLRPNKPLALSKAAAMLKECLDRGEIHSASELLAVWSEVRPEDPTAWHNRALISQSQGDLNSAIEYFENVRRIAPQDEFALAALGKLYFQMRRGKQCVACCDEMLRRNVDPLLAVSMKARILGSIGAYREAMAFLKPYVLHNPGNHSLWLVAASVHESNDNRPEAQAALEKARLILGRANAPRLQDDRASDLNFVESEIDRLRKLMPR